MTHSNDPRALWLAEVNTIHDLTVIDADLGIRRLCRRCGGKWLTLTEAKQTPCTTTSVEEQPR